ncbi:hypothetical protein J4468_00140 [Candidatus Woesearchaeota archaeon]|nr:hypothetical protein [Candidatus Woesearchaeota archaeon]
MKVLEIKQDMYKFDDTDFQPHGGGQPADRGKIKSKSFEGNVLDVTKEDSKIWHKIEITKGELKKGDEVKAEIDMPRRMKLTKMHTGEHILFKALQTFLPDLELDKIRLDEDESSLFVIMPNLDWDVAFKAEELANKIIFENKEVILHKVLKEKANEFKGLRIKAERIKEPEIKVIEIKDFDFSACTGTHCKTTKEIGSLIITHLRSSGPGKYELRFKVDNLKEFLEFSKLSRQGMDILGTERDKFIVTLNNLKENYEKFKKQAREATINQEIEKEEFNGIEFYFHIFEDADKKQLTDKANSVMKENTYVAFVNKTEKGNQLLLFGKKAGDLMQTLLKELNGRGGGKDRFAMGQFDKTAEELISRTKRLIA